MPVPQHERLVRYFSYSHLPSPLREVSQQFCNLAYVMAAWGEQENCTDKAEMTVALRKLLEAKDACVRSMLPL